ncbi:hypothetical protein PIB30_022821 [Stylosanthes scabra]|uniref:Uncharacterized protein n=1 Tax=Stylosanthes scabra TaxID=79078 RepID=A0ABU6VAT4_9FABA|nr:hypothetical protein [Stylosanthes scabra]
MSRAPVSKPPPMVTTDNRNQSLVISVVTIDTMIRRVFVDQGISFDILFRRCIDAPGLTKKDPKAHSDDLVRCSGKRLTRIGSNPPDTKKMKVKELVVTHNSAYNKILGRPTMYKVGAIMTTYIHTRKFITDDDEVEVIREAKSEAEKCHIATKHDSKD